MIFPAGNLALDPALQPTRKISFISQINFKKKKTIFSQPTSSIDFKVVIEIGIRFRSVDSNLSPGFLRFFGVSLTCLWFFDTSGFSRRSDGSIQNLIAIRSNFNVATWRIQQRRGTNRFGSSAPMQSKKGEHWSIEKYATWIPVPFLKKNYHLHYYYCYYYYYYYYYFPVPIKIFRSTHENWARSFRDELRSNFGALIETTIRRRRRWRTRLKLVALGETNWYRFSAYN